MRRLPANLRANVADLRPVLWPVVQTAAAAAAAWELARQLTGHPTPVVAPIVAIVAMGIRPGRRARTAAVMVAAVTFGVLLADVVVRVVGSNTGGIALVVVLAMAIAATISREPVFIGESAVSAVIVLAAPRADQVVVERLLDCLVGGGVAVVFSLLLFPIDPRVTVRRAADDLLESLAVALEEVAAALEAGDADRAWAARRKTRDERLLEDVVDVAYEAARLAPRRFRERERLTPYARAAEHLGPLVRATRVLAGASARLTGAHGAVPALAPPARALAAASRALMPAVAGSVADQERVLVLADEARTAATGATRPAEDLAAATIVHLVGAIAGHLTDALRGRRDVYGAIRRGYAEG